MTHHRLAERLIHATQTTARQPVALSARAFGLAKGALHVARQTPSLVVETVAARVKDHDVEFVPEVPEPRRGEPHRAEPRRAEPHQAGRASEPEQSAAATPVPDLEPADPADRVRVVEEALAAEREGSPAGRATEPSAASREEAHGQASLWQGEREEWDEESAENDDAGQVGVETPAGTTGADTGYSPDTAEAALHQPGTEGIVDAGTAKSIRSESETLRRASDPAPE